MRLAEGHDSGGECGVATFKRFPYFPALGAMWYSFDAGSVHVVSLSSEHPVSPQLTFFQQDMQRLNRTATPWLVVMIHRGLFGSFARDSNALALAKVNAPENLNPRPNPNRNLNPGRG